MRAVPGKCGCDGCYYQDDICCPGWDGDAMKLRDIRPCLIDNVEHIFVMENGDEDN